MNELVGRSIKILIDCLKFGCFSVPRFGFLPLSFSPRLQPSQMQREHGEPDQPLVGGANTGSVTPTASRAAASATAAARATAAVCVGGGDWLPQGMRFTQRMFVHCSGAMFAMVPAYARCAPLQHREHLQDSGSAAVTLSRKTSAAYASSTCSYVVSFKFWTERECNCVLMCARIQAMLFDCP